MVYTVCIFIFLLLMGPLRTNLNQNTTIVIKKELIENGVCQM